MQVESTSANNALESSEAKADSTVTTTAGDASATL